VSDTRSTGAGSGSAATAPWVVDLVVERSLDPADGDRVGRAAWCEWMWARWGDGGLLGIDEGGIDVAEAAALGLTAALRVVDAAAAPADRDWVAARDSGSISCWFGDEQAARAAADELTQLSGCRVIGIRRDDCDIEVWRSGFAPIDVPGFGVILPAWEEGEAGTSPAGTTLFIEPGAGFGTGLHETTQLCLAALDAWRREAGGLGRVLDFGSGSGILGIAAAVLGAPGVDAVEIDPLVHDAIRSNAHRNGVAARMTVSAALPAGADAAYAVIVANIVADVLLAEAEAVCARLCHRAAQGATAGPTSCLVLSGLLDTDVAAVTACYRGHLGLEPIHTSRGDWHCLRFVC
jgi:ribosomal protein L11 methyltransferase